MLRVGSRRRARVRRRRRRNGEGGRLARRRGQSARATGRPPSTPTPRRPLGPAGRQRRRTRRSFGRAWPCASLRRYRGRATGARRTGGCVDGRRRRRRDGRGGHQSSARAGEGADEGGQAALSSSAKQEKRGTAGKERRTHVAQASAIVHLVLPRTFPPRAATAAGDGDLQRLCNGGRDGLELAVDRVHLADVGPAAEDGCVGRVVLRAEGTEGGWSQRARPGARHEGEQRGKRGRRPDGPAESRAWPGRPSPAGRGRRPTQSGCGAA